MKSKILHIAGDASFRTFYRFILNNRSKIIVSAKKEKYKNLIAYSAVNNFLRKNRILSPELFTHDLQKGIIIIEDFKATNLMYMTLNKASNCCIK